MAGETNDHKPVIQQQLSPRDEKLLDMLIAGETEEAVGKAFGISQPRVNQIRHTPASVAYLNRNGGNTRAMLFAMSGHEIRERFTWGGVKMADIIAVFKAAMPKEIAVSITDHRKEAEAIAAEIGKADDAAVVDRIHQDLLLSQRPVR